MLLCFVFVVIVDDYWGKLIWFSILFGLLGYLGLLFSLCIGKCWLGVIGLILGEQCFTIARLMRWRQNTSILSALDNWAFLGLIGYKLDWGQLDIIDLGVIGLHQRISNKIKIRLNGKQIRHYCKCN